MINNKHNHPNYFKLSFKQNSQLNISDYNAVIYEYLHNTAYKQQSFLYIYGNKYLGQKEIVIDYLKKYNGKLYSNIPLKNMENDLLIYDVIAIEVTPNMPYDDEEKIFFLYNLLLKMQKSLIILSEYPIPDMNICIKDLKSRLLSCTMFKIRSKLTDNDMKNILQGFFNVKQLFISTNVINYILAKSTRDPKYLYTLVEEIEHYAFTYKHDITIPFLKKYLNL